MEHPEALSQTLNASWQALQDSLTRPAFYVELLLIGVAMVIAWLVSFAVRHRVGRHLERHPPQKIDPAFILQPLKILTPVLAFFALGIAKPFAQQYAEGGEWTAAIMQITLAFAAARMLLLLIGARPVAYFMGAVIIAIAALDATGFMSSTKAALDSVTFSFGKFRLSMLGLSQGLIILVFVFWCAHLLSHTLENYLQKGARLSHNTRVLIVKFFKIFVYFSAFLITLSAMGIDLTALAIFGGAMGVGVGLGLQKITANFVSGITLLLEKSIKIGDMIEVAGLTGWVRQLNIRYALIETFDGRELLIPNDMLISTQVTNWTYSTDHARIDIDITLTFGSDGRRARDIMLETARAHPRCLAHPEPSCHLRALTEFGQHFLLSFWIPDIHEGRLSPQSDVLFTLLARFRAEGIALVDRNTLPA